MLKYLDIIGWLHAALGGLGTLLGLLTICVPLLMALYGVYDFVYGVLYLMVDPIFLKYAFEELVSVFVLCAVLAVPALLMLVAFGVELIAGVGILRRWRQARVAGFAACAPALALGLPGILLGVGTVMVLNDDDVKRELAAA